MPIALHGDAPSFAALETLALSADIRDRAFAASVLSLRRAAPEAEDRARVAVLYARIREAGKLHHAETRARIRTGTLDREAFVASLRETPSEVRDHFIEEVLDVAYPPLDEAPLSRDEIHYCPSGLDEILFLLKNADLRPGATFVDLGSGLGKVVLLVALLTGAHAYGLERDPHLVCHASAAARSLELDNARFIEGDIREAPLPRADVYYMYSPLTQPTAVVARLKELATERRTLLFSQALDLGQLPWLKATGAASYWLVKYEGRIGASFV
jgi:protein-L-isoaspartate O-methyltransferase